MYDWGADNSVRCPRLCVRIPLPMKSAADVQFVELDFTVAFVTMESLLPVSEESGGKSSKREIYPADKSSTWMLATGPMFTAGKSLHTVYFIFPMMN